MPHAWQLPVQPPFFFFLSFIKEKTVIPITISNMANAMIVTALSEIHENMTTGSFPANKHFYIFTF